MQILPVLLVAVLCTAVSTSSGHNASEGGTLSNLWDNVKVVSTNIKEIVADNAQVVQFLGRKAGTYVKDTAVSKFGHIKEKFSKKDAAKDDDLGSKDVVT